MKIYLASTSPRRKELLEQIGLEVQTVNSNYKEDMSLDMEPLELAKFLSRGKAESACKNLESGIVLAADTIAVFEDNILGKPITKAKAKEMLEMLSGQCIDSITGFTIIDAKSKDTVSKACLTKVYFKKLNEAEIDNYIKTKEPLDKAGAFAIQGLGGLLIEKIEGDYNTIVGLPLFQVALELKKFDIYLL